MSITKLEQSHVDLNKLKPLNPNRLVAFVNHMVIRITKELNELVLNVDTRMEKLHVKISQCEANLTILETKLNSIPGLAHNLTTAKPTPQPTAQAETGNVVTSPATPIASENSKPELVVTQESKTDSPAAQATEEETNETKPVEKDPRLAKFYKMVQVGVPLPAVHQKMIGEDLDPNLLVL